MESYIFTLKVVHIGDKAGEYGLVANCELTAHVVGKDYKWTLDRPDFNLSGLKHMVGEDPVVGRTYDIAIRPSQPNPTS